LGEKTIIIEWSNKMISKKLKEARKIEIVYIDKNKREIRVE
jgi:uncharacterized pyridoxamine 5'-phosphate oxidase family protein